VDRIVYDTPPAIALKVINVAIPCDLASIMACPATKVQYVTIR
jgi:hypothetical protein